jgi:hypothetical protein
LYFVQGGLFYEKDRVLGNDLGRRAG